MAKPQRSSLKGAGQQATVQQNTQQNTQPIATPTNAVGLQFFATLTDQQQADMVNKAKTAKAVPGFPDTFYQKFVMSNNLDTKPNLVTDAQLDAMPGYDYFRGIHASSADVADRIVMNTLMEDFTHFSDSGGSMMGRGIYAMHDLSEDVGSYGSNSGVNNIMRFKLNSDAKTISWGAAQAMYSNELASGSKLGRALKGIDSKDGISIVAAAKGYAAITYDTLGKDWINILSRDKLSASMQFHRVTQNDRRAAQRGKLTWYTMEK